MLILLILLILILALGGGLYAGAGLIGFSPLGIIILILVILWLLGYLH